MKEKEREMSFNRFGRNDMLFTNEEYDYIVNLLNLSDFNMGVLARCEHGKKRGETCIKCDGGYVYDCAPYARLDPKRIAVLGIRQAYFEPYETTTYGVIKIAYLPLVRITDDHEYVEYISNKAHGKGIVLPSMFNEADTIIRLVSRVGIKISPYNTIKIRVLSGQYYARMVLRERCDDIR